MRKLNQHTNLYDRPEVRDKRIGALRSFGTCRDGVRLQWPYYTPCNFDLRCFVCWHGAGGVITVKGIVWWNCNFVWIFLQGDFWVFFYVFCIKVVQLLWNNVQNSFFFLFISIFFFFVNKSTPALSEYLYGWLQKY